MCSGLGVLTICAATDDVLEGLQRTARGAGEQISLALANLRLQEILRSLSIRDPLNAADAALYRAKHERRDRVVVARDMAPLQSAE